MNQLLDLRSTVTVENWQGNSTLTVPRYDVDAITVRMKPSSRTVGREGQMRRNVKLRFSALSEMNLDTQCVRGERADEG